MDNNDIEEDTELIEKDEIDDDEHQSEEENSDDGMDDYDEHDELIGGAATGEEGELSIEQPEGFYYPEESDEEYDSDDYYEKFDDELKKKYILDKHPELNQKNFHEIEVLTRIKRDENNIIIDDNHQTIPMLTKYEKTRVLGMRLKQLNHGAKPFIKVASNILDNYVIAYDELKKKKIPFIIARPLSKNKVEYWDVNDLELLE